MKKGRYVKTRREQSQLKRARHLNQKRKKLPLRDTIANNFFALKTIWTASPSYLIIYVGSALIYGILGFLSEGYLLRRIVNGINSGESMESIVSYVVSLGIICFVSYSAMQWFWQVISPIKYFKIGSYVEKMLFKKSAQVELACYEKPAFYDRYVRAMDEAYNRILLVMQTLRDIISTIIGISANSLLLFVIDPWLIVFGLLPMLFGSFRRMANVANHKLEIEKKPINRRAEYVRRTFYLAEYAKEIRIGKMYKQLLQNFRESFSDYGKTIKKYGTLKAIYFYVERMGLEVLTILGATLYSVWSTLCIGSANGGMSIGDCIVVLSSIGTISRHLGNTIQYIAQFGEHALFLDDVRFFLDYEPKIVGGDEIATGESGELEAKNIRFRYDGSNRDTLKDINMVLHKGEHIALVGNNGSGKSTLVKLLLRFYDPTSGEITMDNQNIKHYTLSSYRDCFSTVFQDFKVFSMSVKDNILLRPEEDGDTEAIYDALVESDAWKKIKKFRNGINTILTREFDDQGENLSIGEQQKLSLARVFADSSPFVLLDEPSSALDPIAEYTMFQNMMRATEGRSVIFISHRLSSAVLADRVILMANGEIIETGTHSELMALNGRYAEMFNRQAENYLGDEVYAHE